MQPVANQASVRTADDLIRLIAAGTLHPSSVTEQEEAVLMKSFRAKERRLLDRLESALADGRVRIARKQSAQLRRSLATRWLALWREKPGALADKPDEQQSARIAKRAERIRKILASLNRVGDLKEPASAIVYTKLKDRNKSYRYVCAPRPSLTSGGTIERRVIFKFDWIDKARQRLIASSLKPFASYHPSQFMLTGRGRSAVCEYLRREVPNLSADHVFMQVDVRDFFGSINPAWIEGRFRIAEAIIRRQMHSGEMRILMDGRTRAYLTGGESNERVRRVLPQGSALSPLVAEMAMAEVLEGLSDHLQGALLVTYSDNLGIFVPAAQAAAIEDRLRSAFGTSGAGPFALTFSRPVPVAAGFSFLDYQWQLENGTLHIVVDSHLAEMRAIVLRAQLLECLTREELRGMRGRILAQANEWKFWPGIARWKSELLADWERAWDGLTVQPTPDRLAA